MNDLDNAGLENEFKKLWSAFQGVLVWKWDSRFETALAEFGIKKKDNVRSTLERFLRMTWDGSNMANAPDPVRAINNRLGGLRSGQLLFTSDPSGDVFIFCAWWPWGDDKTISIRVAPSYLKLLDSEKAEKTRLLKSWFGI